MAKFHDLKIADVRKETADTISVAFDIPQDLWEEYRHIHGQYVTLKLTVNGEELRRSYSICSSPQESEFRIAVKRVEGGRVSSYLNQQAKPGDVLSVMPPMGNFYTQLDAAHKKQYVAFAAGSGITPVISILKTVLHKEPQSSFVLFYGNRDSLSIIFKEELERLREKYGDRLDIYHILSREQLDEELFYGRIDRSKVQLLLDQFVDLSRETEYFICGPEGMMNDVSETLTGRGVNKANVHYELFTSPVTSEKDVTKEAAQPSVSWEGVSSVTIILDDEETTIELPKSGNAILDAALEADLDVPFACKGAVCCTCKAKVTEGKVEMEMNYALTDEEVEEGYVLTCQSHPVTERVTVNYDEA